MPRKWWCPKVLGIICLAFGAASIVLPILPTTPFVIAAVLCFSAGSLHLAVWLEQSRYFGPYIDHYRNKTSVPLRQKIGGILFLWVILGVSMVIVQKPFVNVIFCVVGVLVTLHLVLLKTRKKVLVVGEFKEFLGGYLQNFCNIKSEF